MVMGETARSFVVGTDLWPDRNDRGPSDKTLPKLDETYFGTFWALWTSCPFGAANYPDRP